MDSTKPGKDQMLGASLENYPTGWGTSAGGCGYLLFVLLISTGMLALNAVLCLSVYSVFMLFGPEQIVKNPQLAPYIGQLFFFLVPVLLTVLEWNLYDRLNRLFGRRV